MSIDEANSPPIGEVTPISRIEREAGRVLVCASGDIDMATARSLTAAVLAAATDPVDTVTLDLGDVGFMDSSGLNAIINCRSRLAARSVEAEDAPP